MKYQEINKKDDAALTALVAEKRDILRKARFDTTGADHKEVREAKKVIAQALTALSARAKEQANTSS